MERTVVRCADGHVFSTASFPMQQAERLGPGRSCGVRDAPACGARCLSSWRSGRRPGGERYRP
ncbi:hypothetical protein ACFQ3Z_25145 [Streptomyces nogalater]